MKKLNQIVKERSEKQKELKVLINESEERKERLKKEIDELLKMENIGTSGIDVEKVQIAKEILNVFGSPQNRVDGRVLLDAAIEDIANDCKHLKSEFFGNKRYDGFYQACDCNYGYGPRHGGIVDEIGLRGDARNRVLSDEEKYACIYYLKNYTKVKEAESLIKS